jgi:hypothetical protein
MKKAEIQQIPCNPRKNKDTYNVQIKVFFIILCDTPTDMLPGEIKYEES